MQRTNNHLTLVPEPSRRVAVVAGKDNLSTAAALRTAQAAADAVRDAGAQAHIVWAGTDLAEELLDLQVDLVIPAALDMRLLDGALPAVCDRLGLAYAGAGVGAASACWDRVACRHLLERAGLSQPVQTLVTRGAWTVLGPLTLPSLTSSMEVVVKPRRGRGGHGVRFVGPDGLNSAVRTAFLHDLDDIVVDARVRGRELSVLLTGSPGQAWAVGVADVVVDERDPMTCAVSGRQWQAARLTDELRSHGVLDCARRAYVALGLGGLATVDLIVDDRGGVWTIDVDCALDWSSPGRLQAYLDSGGVSSADLVRHLADDGSRRAA